MLENLRSPLKKIIEPLAAALVRAHISASTVTVIGSFATIIAAIATGISGYLFVGAAMLTILVLFDSLDGSVAALSGGGTAFGAFLDSTLDRIADWALWTLVGLISALTAMLTSFVTPYARARAEAVGFEAKNGIATRSDRIAIILIALALRGLGAPVAVLSLAMLVLTVLGIITVFQRIATVYKQSVHSV